MEFHAIKNADGRLVLAPKRRVERANGPSAPLGAMAPLP
jgi:hypothetical protein